jgi:hypothetical protein
MCSICKDILGKKTIKHDPAYCPIAESRYCGICAKYGHTTLKCHDKESLVHRKPTCLEQLIPGSVLDAYGIMSNTPLPDPDMDFQNAHTPVLEVIDDEKNKNIKAILLNHGKSEKGTNKELRNRLQKLGEELHMKVVYIKPMITAE